MVDHNFKGRSQVRLEKTTVDHTLDWYPKSFPTQHMLFFTGLEKSVGCYKEHC